jgi:hypothetical protein
MDFTRSWQNLEFKFEFENEFDSSLSGGWRGKLRGSMSLGDTDSGEGV